MLKLFKDSLRGQASLAKAFWLVYIAFGIILGLIVILAASFFIPHLLEHDVLVQHQSLFETILFPYTLFSAICVWRCAKNSWILWNILARIIVVLGVLRGLVGIFYLIYPAQ